MNNLRNSIYLTAICCLFFYSQSVSAQGSPPPNQNKAVKAMETVNQKTQQGVDITSQMAGQTSQIVANIQQAYDNVKGIVKIFEPILKFRLKKNTTPQQGQQANTPVEQQPNSYQQSGSYPTEQPYYPPTNSQEAQQPYQDPYSQAPAYDNSNYSQNAGPASQPYYDYNSSSSNVTYNDIMQGIPLIAESPAYNTDGTANLGSQNHTQYGCYLDILKGAVMDEIDAAGNSMSVDLIFTATDYYGSAPMYALLTPSYVKNDFFSNYYFRGAKYKDANIPPKQWENVIESEVALTSLTGVQFDKIQTNDQLAAVVKQCSGFKDKFESRTKLDGKVFAIKTEIDSRTAYALMYVVSHYGTTGANGYLKIKLKVTGYDANGDGNPDANLYNTQY